MTAVNLAAGLGLNVVGAFVGVGLWNVLHVDDFFYEHHERVEARRARKRYKRASEAERRRKEGWEPNPPPPSPGVGTVARRPPPDELGPRHRFW